MQPLSDDEAGTLYHVQTFGSDGYPISKLGRKWSVARFPVLFATKRAAIEQFEAWHALALERWRAMKLANPNLILTAVGIREMS